MKIAFFSAHRFEKEFFLNAQKKFIRQEVVFFEPSLSFQTAPLAKGFDCVCCFVTDVLDAQTLGALKKNGVRLIALRSAGYNNVDIACAAKLDLPILRVPAYSPHAVAEYAVGLLLSVNRKIHKAYVRIHDQNFSLDGLMGFDLFGKTVGVIGTGRIGSIFAQILKGFGCEIIAHDTLPNAKLVEEKTASYVPFLELCKRADIISLHLPLTPKTKHILNADAFANMKSGVILLNTGRGGLIDTLALIDVLKTSKIGGVGLDVYEEEEGVFFKDLSEQVISDDVLVRLITFPHVLLTSHQAFLTREALQSIAEITIQNISDFQNGIKLRNKI